FARKRPKSRYLREKCPDRRLDSVRGRSRGPAEQDPAPRRAPIVTVAGDRGFSGTEERFLMAVCVVTGGAGFLGSHLCEHLLELGDRVICIDNLDTGSLENIEHIGQPEFEFIEHDITEFVSIEGPIDFIYHLA